MVNILVPTLPPFHFLSLNMWEKTDDSFASRRLSFPAVSQATPRAAAAAAGIPLHARTQAPGRPRLVHAHISLPSDHTSTHITGATFWG